jgi:ATP-dependent DNA helicase RecG
MWEVVREEIDKGKVAYVVCPMISQKEAEAETDEDDIFFGAQILLDEIKIEETTSIENGIFEVINDGRGGKNTQTPLVDKKSGQFAFGGVAELHSVDETVRNLRSSPLFKGIEIEGLHGKTNQREKDRIFTQFNSGEIKLLVSTTVVEVGVDVKDATVMVILDANRFGVSTLHQLRGRIGRNDDNSICFLVTNFPIRGDEEERNVSQRRLSAVVNTNDGFKLAEDDLQIRGEGDILGGKQSGVNSALKLLKVIEDAELISDARKRAERLLEKDPSLSNHPDIKTVLDNYTKRYPKDIVIKY